MSTDDPTPPACISTDTLPLPACSIGQAAREDDGTLQWEWGLAKPAEVDGFVGIAVAYVHGPQPSERQLVMIQPVAKYDRQWSNCCHGSGSVQWWEPGTSLLCKVVNTGRAAAVVRSGHRIAKVIALNVRDDDRFRSLFLHYTLNNPTPEPPDEIPPTQSSDSGQTSTTTWGRYRRRQHWPAEWRPEKASPTRGPASKIGRALPAGHEGSEGTYGRRAAYSLD